MSRPLTRPASGLVLALNLLVLALVLVAPASGREARRGRERAGSAHGIVTGATSGTTPSSAPAVVQRERSSGKPAAAATTTTTTATTDTATSPATTTTTTTASASASASAASASAAPVVLFDFQSFAVRPVPKVCAKKAGGKCYQCHQADPFVTDDRLVSLWGAERKKSDVKMVRQDTVLRPGLDRLARTPARLFVFHKDCGLTAFAILKALRVHKAAPTLRHLRPDAWFEAASVLDRFSAGGSALLDAARHLSTALGAPPANVVVVGPPASTAACADAGYPVVEVPVEGGLTAASFDAIASTVARGAKYVVPKGHNAHEAPQDGAGEPLSLDDVDVRAEPVERKYPVSDRST